MGLELEDEVGDVDKKKHDGGSTGNDEKTRSAALLDDTELAGLHEDVVDVILDGLGHEIGGRNDERFCEASGLNGNPTRSEMNSLIQARVMREEAFWAAVTWKLLS